MGKTPFEVFTGTKLNIKDEEFKSLKENDTFTLTPLPSGKNVIEGRWVYTIKEGQKGNPIYKARYVVKGYSQTKDVDYVNAVSRTNLLYYRTN